MGLFDQFPYTNFHELNLDWILKALKELEHTIEQFVAINALKYADPIQWNITSQYEKNTIVIDPKTGTAYISVQPVPTGVALTNEDYWTVVFDLRSFVVRAAKNFTIRYEEDTTLTATFNSVAGDWLVWGDTLYIANVNITAGDSYVVDGNIRRITVEEVTNKIYTTFNSMIGDIKDLDTTDKNNLVAAINEAITNISNESTARAEADTTLQQNINDEATARSEADTTLQQNINDEATARAEADTTLQQNINDKATALQNNITLLNKGSLQTPEMYGAVGDGITDDTEACQQCLNENPISYFPNNYRVTNLIIPPGHVLMGGSVDTKGIICTVGSVVPMASAIIMNIRLHSYNTQEIGNHSAAIEIYKPFVSIINVHVINCAQALYVHDDNGTYCSGLQVFDLHVEHCTNSIIYITKSNDLYFDNCILNSSLDGSTQSTTSDGIQLYGFCQAINFVNCAILQSRYGIYSNNPTPADYLSQVAMCKFTSCWFDSNVQSAKLEHCRNFTFENCWFAGRNALNSKEGDGAYLQYCESISFIGCTFDSCNNAGIQIRENTDDVVVTGCKIQNCPIGVYVGADSNRIAINNNFFGNTKIKDIAITMTTWLFLSNVCSGIIAIGNITSGLSITNNSTSEYNIIDNNMVMPVNE